MNHRINIKDLTYIKVKGVYRLNKSLTFKNTKKVYSEIPVIECIENEFFTKYTEKYNFYYSTVNKLYYKYKQDNSKIDRFNTDSIFRIKCVIIHNREHYDHNFFVKIYVNALSFKDKDKVISDHNDLKKLIDFHLDEEKDDGLFDNLHYSPRRYYPEFHLEFMTKFICSESLDKKEFINKFFEETYSYMKKNYM